jgi:hypothetical protein
LLAKTPEDGRPKMEVETKDMEVAPEITTKSCLTGRRQVHLPGNSSKKREKFPTTVVEYEENEVRDLLALEIPKKKKKIKKKDNSKALCWNCMELGHLAEKCPKKQAKRNKSCHLSEMQPKGTLCNKMSREKYIQSPVNGDNQRCPEFKEKTQPGVANWKRVFSATSCNRC